MRCPVRCPELSGILSGILSGLSVLCPVLSGSFWTAPRVRLSGSVRKYCPVVSGRVRSCPGVSGRVRCVRLCPAVVRLCPAWSGCVRYGEQARIPTRCRDPAPSPPRDPSAPSGPWAWGALNRVYLCHKNEGKDEGMAKKTRDHICRGALEEQKRSVGLFHHSLILRVNFCFPLAANSKEERISG